MSNLQNYHPGYDVANKVGDIIDNGNKPSLIALITVGVIGVGALAIKAIEKYVD
ncbi:MAG: hypothetical protein MJZ53_02615 [Paludibacteraceae bacterium]|nr:hypothetical protein [Paludibacteraceae bacterium]